MTNCRKKHDINKINIYFNFVSDLVMLLKKIEHTSLKLIFKFFLNGIIHLQFLDLSIINLGISRRDLDVNQPTV